MSRVEAKRDALEVERLLAGAARTVRSVPYCWLATTRETAEVDARPMGRLLHDPGEDAWTIRFVTDGRSRKAADLRRDGTLALVFQHDPSEAWVTLTGKAALHAEPAEVRRRWRAGYDAYFPTELDRANALFVEVEVERMALWIRGVTPEPFGLRPTTLERAPEGGWRVTPA